MDKEHEFRPMKPVFSGRTRRFVYTKEREWVRALAGCGALGIFLASRVCLREATFGHIFVLWYGAWAVFFLSCMFMAYVAVLAISVNVRRLHDVGRSGWWTLVPVFFLIKNSLLHLDEDGEPGANAWGVNEEEQSAATEPAGDMPVPEGVALPPLMEQKELTALYRSAAWEGKPAARFKLAMCYFYGRSGTVQNRSLAFRWLYKAFESKSPEASVFLDHLQPR